KLEHIAPASAHPRHMAPGWAGTMNRVAYAGCYSLGFGVALPVYAVASLFRPTDNALTRGLRDGAAAASERVEQIAAWTRGEATPSPEAQEANPALAPA